MEAYGVTIQMQHSRSRLSYLFLVPNKMKFEFFRVF